MTQSPYRCETCKREHTDHVCKYRHTKLSDSDRELLWWVGCASHSDVGLDYDILMAWLELNKYTAINARVPKGVSQEAWLAMCSGRFKMGEETQQILLELQTDPASVIDLGKRYGWLQ